MGATYKAPDYSDKKYKSNINTTFYKNAITDYTNQANKNRTNQIADANKERSAQLRNAYIQNMQNKQALNQSLAMSGIRGGATESSNLALANQYGTARQGANNTYAQSVTDINRNIDQNIADYTSDMKSREEEYRQNLAQAKWQADREDTLNEYNAKNEAWNNYYMDYYSGVSKKKLNSALKKAKKQLSGAKTQAAKIKYMQKIRAIQNRRGVLANK